MDTTTIETKRKTPPLQQEYWDKMARKDWIVNGDRNSKKFQIRANCRRKKKIMIKIKDDCGIWINDKKIIAEKLIIDYVQRFKSEYILSKATKINFKS